MLRPARTAPALLAFALLAATAFPARAQGEKVTVIKVTDVEGRLIPFALVQIENGASRVADDSGRAVFNMKSPDSLRLQVRRMGFSPFIGWARRDSTTKEFLADLIPLPRALNAVTVEGRRDTPLARRGFYDRMERVSKGAQAARFVTPEELDLRNPLNISSILGGDRYVKVQNYNGRSILMSTRNPNCAMDILLDGQRLSGTLEEAMGMRPGKPDIRTLTSIDEIININSIAAIEVYGSIAQAPVELQRAAGSSFGCGLVALWTGSRR